MKPYLLIAVKRYLQTDKKLKADFGKPRKKKNSRLLMLYAAWRSSFIKIQIPKCDVVILSGSDNCDRQIEYVKSLLPRSLTTYQLPRKMKKKKNLSWQSIAFWRGFRVWSFISRIAKREQQYAPSTLKLALWYNHFYRMLLDSNAHAIIVANDHSLKQCAFIYAAKRIGLKTIYAQHAHVVESFPRLVFDLSILDGAKAYEIYHRIGEIQGKVCYKGLPGECRPLKPLPKSKLNVIIAPTVNSYPSAIFDFCKKLASQELIDLIYVRLHPRSDPMPYNLLQSIDKTKVAPGKLPLTKIINQFDLAIAGNSSIHLEFLKYGTPSLIYHGLENYRVNDIYDFLPDRIIYELEGPENIDTIAINTFYSDKNWSKRFSKYDASHAKSHVELEALMIKKLSELLLQHTQAK